jgi:predicted DsbA family dithiol-disulfide isomerase
MRAEKDLEEAPRTNPDAKRKDITDIGQEASIDFDFQHGELQMLWQPVQSQRLLLWAGCFGLQEELADALGQLHFERGQTVADHSTLLEAVEMVGLDTEKAAVFLASNGFADDVWHSYGRMIRHFGITEIPVFVFNKAGCPGIFTPGFIDGETENPLIVIGSASTDIFVTVFTELSTHAASKWRETEARAGRARDGKGRVQPRAKI